MTNESLKLLSRLGAWGVLHRDQTKNEVKALRRFLKKGYVSKVYRKKKVFYQLTETALPLLEWYRQQLVFRVRIEQALKGRASPFYAALLGDLRFLDESRREAEPYRFLGDWQLLRPVNKYGLALSQERFYEGQLS